MTGNGHEHPARISRRALLAAAPLGAVAACSGPVPVPDRRMVGVGFEDVAAGTTRLRELATRLDGAGIGRIETATLSSGLICTNSAIFLLLFQKLSPGQRRHDRSTVSASQGRKRDAAFRLS